MRRNRILTGMAALLLLGCCLPGAIGAGSGEVVFSQDFQGKDGKKVEDLGWVRTGTDEQSTWEIRNGVLEVTCFNKPYKGGNIRTRVPFVSRGELSFDVNINAKASTGYRHLSLQVGLYNLMTAFNGYGKSHWMRLLNGKGDWAKISNDVAQGKTVKCKIVFDNSKETVEYYCGDMENPSYVEQGVKLSPSTADGKDASELFIGNYGLATGTIVNQISNIKLVGFDGKPGASADAEPQLRAGQTTVYRGVSFERYRLDEILGALHVSDARVYTMLVGLALQPRNSFRLDRLPSLLSPVTDSLIIMADMPLGPGQAVQEALRRRVREDVASGAHLVILGGLFTLDKGEFAGSSLEELLPVRLAGSKGVTKADKPLPVDGAGGAEKVASVLYYHDLAPASNARVLASAGGHPLVVSRPFGKGIVTVFTGIPCGTASGPAQAFWEWKDWPRYMAQMICRAEGS